MKLMIASDLHGSSVWTKKLIDKFNEENCDNLLLLGDLLYHGPRNNLTKNYDTQKVAELLNSIKNNIICVRGNCDSEVDQAVLNFEIRADYINMYLENRLIFLTHGHIYNETNLPALQHFDVLLNGHTHVTTFNKHKDFVFVNPGSTSIPKQDTKHSCSIYENRTFCFYNLVDGTILKKEII